ncbi:MAG: hypothetical protein J6T24_01395 [Clostridia bacterium]|nr:hypothetical protein [Clostridia bacterium]
MRLIPSTQKNTANYWCSWRNQRLFMPNPFFHMRLYDQKQHEAIQRDMLSDAFLFGSPGVVSRYMEGIRGDMLVMLDDGWDLPYEGDYTRVGSLILNRDRFPYGGRTPADDLAILNEKITSLGYSGTGLWVPMTRLGEDYAHPGDLESFIAYWRERAAWMRHAGIAYLKVDWGVHSRHTHYRAALSELLHKEVPGMLVEHAVLDGWFFDPTADRAILKNTLAISDSFRCYDVKFEFNSASTLGRAAAMLGLDCDLAEGCLGLINVGEEPYLAAALGCTMGIMSHPLLRGSVITMLPDSFQNGMATTRMLKSDFHSFDHYERALRWQRLAPAFPYVKGGTEISDTVLEDSWTYDKEPYPFPRHELRGRSVRQCAPAAVARGTALPHVSLPHTPYEEKTYLPYTVASRHPVTGAFSVATLSRTVDGVMNCTTPAADVLCRALSADCPFAAFGEYRTLTLEFDRPIDGYRLFGGDILLDEAGELTGVPGVCIEGNRLTLHGDLLHRIGTEAASFHDLSDPGTVFSLIPPEN